MMRRALSDSREYDNKSIRSGMSPTSSEEEFGPSGHVKRVNQVLYETESTCTDGTLIDPGLREQLSAQGLEVDFQNGFQEDVGELPEHSCSYCTYHDPKAMCRCHICKKWFCNGKGKMNASHIVMHLLTSRHKEVTTHEDNVLSDDVIECYICSCKNIFLLGFVPSTVDEVVVLICREPCLYSSTLKVQNWNPDKWLPLVEGRQLLSWIAETPRASEMHRARPITSKQSMQLEERWKTDPNVKFEELARLAMKDKLNLGGVTFPKIPATFRDGYHYCEVFKPIIEAEAEENKKVQEATILNDINITWSTNVNRKKVASFVATLDQNKLCLGAHLQISLPNGAFNAEAIISHIELSATSGNTIDAELVKSDPDNSPSVSTGFSVQPLFNDIVFQRMQNAMVMFATDTTSISDFLFSTLLGQQTTAKVLEGTIPESLTVPGLSSLNPSQEKAVRSVLRSPLSLIQGPPGTGKTLTTASIVYHMKRMYLAQILVCAPSNVAVDHLAERISMTGLKVVRMIARGREALPNGVEGLCLHTLAGHVAMKSPPQSELRKLYQLKQEVGMLEERDFRKYKTLFEKVEQDLLSSADIICVTCSTAADKRLANFRFQHVIVDESTQSAEPETIIPVVMGAKQLCLVGDHCQLGPVVNLRAAEAAGLGRSLFERLVSMGHRPLRLEVQYRMHPFLSEFSSNYFYEGTLQNGVSAEERQSHNIFQWPNPDKPMFFYNSISPEEMGAAGTSVLNRTEAALAEKFVTYLIKHGANPDDIAVITPYEAQRCFLLRYLARNGPLGPDVYQGVKVASVDSFQGREKEFTIISCVRSNESHAIGFLKDWRRLNVALTRAKRGVIVIGNAKMLARHPLWYSFLQHCMVHGLVVDGPIQQLQPMNITLPKPRLTINAMTMASALAQAPNISAMCAAQTGGGHFGAIGSLPKQMNGSHGNQSTTFQHSVFEGQMNGMYAMSSATEDCLSHSNFGGDGSWYGPYIDSDYVPGQMNSDRVGGTIGAGLASVDGESHHDFYETFGSGPHHGM